MARRFEGQIAVVTGGSTGIGLAAAERFATEGAVRRHVRPIAKETCHE